ncbi:MAG TPA: hypothetical protein VMW07_00510 [Gallionella sp.]|nr:hypothetical protein [Gallionella sp.]
MTASHTWKFFRAGGFDQVLIDSGADLLALHELDQKLWVALSCPARGIEFDDKTLAMIDADGDGQVRASEVLAAVAWVSGLLKNADLLVKGAGSLALDEINDSGEEGKQLLASARHILRSLDKPGASEIALADMGNIGKLVAGLELNGDGVICAGQIHDAGLRVMVEDIAKCAGTASDLSGEPGINQDIADNFFAEAEAYTAWREQGESDPAVLMLGEQTQVAATSFYAIRNKVDDYFTRCQLAAYDARAAEPLSRAVEDYRQLAAHCLSVKSTGVADFPLATVAADKSLPLTSGINPAWQEAMAALRTDVIVPLLGNKNSLTIAEWSGLCARFAAFNAWQTDKPVNNVEQLGITRLREIVGGGHKEKISELIRRDKAVETEVNTIRSVEKLLRYNRDLFKLLNNFVSFRDFYTKKDKAVFQVGTLYLDGRSCELCVRVDDVNKHATFANMSGVCLAYCECVRNGGAEKMNIAAAFTAGDSDFLLVGRNGVFYDRKGQDWNASIVHIIDHPISIRQAFWSPYKKLIKAISAQLQKLAASKASSAESKMIKAVVDGGKPLAGAPAAAPKPAFDVAKFAGIFAAIGLAIGAIGGILVSVVGGMMSLKFWQIPLALVGLMLLISLPSMVLAWFKLKQRSLGPILDACGWAINSRVFINIPFGTSLTALASLPNGASRTLADPFAEKRVLWPYYLVIVACLVALLVFWKTGYFG